MRRTLCCLLSLMLLAVACSTNGSLRLDDAAVASATAEAQDGTTPTVTERTVDEDDEPSPAESEPPATIVAGPAAADRVVVATGNGQVYLVDPDGGNRLDLVVDGAGGQPVWSPNGRRIAWSQRDGSGFSITSTNADGSGRLRSGTLFSGYFGYWNPTSTQLGFLGNAPPGTGLVLDGGTGMTLDSTVDSDTFYYFSWSPDGTQWVVNSGSGLSIVDLDGTKSVIGLAPARFRAPTWAPDNTILVAIRREGRNVIVRLSPDGTVIEELLEVGDVANFVLDPTGRFLAVESITLGAGQDDPSEGITISDGEDGRVAMQASEQTELIVLDLATGETAAVHNARTGGFWWSPDGTKLAVLVAELAPEPAAVQWLVWSGGESFRTERFRVTPAFAGAYMPFFDQFAQSVTPWSPDSSRFVYTGFDPSGAQGVFVQSAEPDTPRVRIADDGAIAFWSPT